MEKTQFKFGCKVTHFWVDLMVKLFRRNITSVIRPLTPQIKHFYVIKKQILLFCSSFFIYAKGPLLQLGSSSIFLHFSLVRALFILSLGIESL